MQAALFGDGLYVHTAFQFTTRHRARNALTHFAFQHTQIVGHFELQVQIAVIDRAQFQIDALATKVLLGTGKTSHAVDHNRYFLSGKYNMPSP